jgi:hypothetical protein
MKPTNKLLALAVATALGSSAHALPPSATIAFTFYEAGGSAQENSLYTAFYQLCNRSTVDVYSSSTASPVALDPSYLVASCTTDPTAANAPFTTATNILFFYKFNGGSFPNGAFPLAFPTSNASSNLNYPAIAKITAAVASGNSGTPTPSNPSYQYVADASDPHPTDFGVTDVEVPLFNYAYNLNGVAALTSSQLSGIAQEGVYDDVFGFVVTNNIYNGTVAFPHPKTNFTKPEIVGILSGTTTNWNQMFADDGTIMPTKAIAFLDRGSGSGTKAGENQYFLNYPGAKAYTGGAGYVVPGSVSGSNINHYTSSTFTNSNAAYQDVKESSTAQCISDLNNANVAGVYATSILAAQAAPAFNQSGGSTQYSFVKINGVGIDTATGTGNTATDNINTTGQTHYTNVVTGAYDYVLQNSFNYRAGFMVASSPGTITTAPGGSAANVVFAYAMRNNLQSEGLASAHSGNAFPLSVPGVLVDPVLAPAQDAGVILDTRNKVSAAPFQPSFDAQSVTGGAITFGTDPL